VSAVKDGLPTLPSGEGEESETSETVPAIAVFYTGDWELEHKLVVDEVVGASLDGDHLGDLVAGSIGELLHPDDGDGVGAPQYGDEYSCAKEALLILILPTDLLQVGFRHDRFQAIGKAPDVADMVNGG
jgi:hypothetical protein